MIKLYVKFDFVHWILITSKYTPLLLHFTLTVSLSEGRFPKQPKMALRWRLQSGLLKLSVRIFRLPKFRRSIQTRTAATIFGNSTLRWTCQSEEVLAIHETKEKRDNLLFDFAMTAFQLRNSIAQLNFKYSPFQKIDKKVTKSLSKMYR